MERGTAVPGLRHLSRASNPERIEALIRWSLYFILALGPVLVAQTVAQARDWRGVGAGVLLLVACAQFSCAVGLLRGGLAYSQGRRGAPHVWLALLGLSTAAVVVLAVTWFPGVPASGEANYLVTVLFPLAMAVCALSVYVGGRRLALVCLGSTAVWWVVLLLVGVGGRQVAAGILVGTVLVFALAFSTRASAWMVGVVWEQERRREVDARLAVAEERLRFSRDLHDIFGRTLSTVAVKSELAAELAARGRTGAAEQMIEVRRIAQDALREVRAVAAGYRVPDLASELAGSRSLLRSAGIEVTVAADDGALPPHVQEALAWVVREGVTNVVRHSRASWCRIAVRPDDDGAATRLEVANDGAQAPSGRGSGLVGLSERLGAVGGNLDTELDGSTFRLAVRVPHADAGAAP